MSQIDIHENALCFSSGLAELPKSVEVGGAVFQS